MAFNAAASTAFFTNAPQMGLTNEVRSRLAVEGLATVDDFAFIAFLVNLEILISSWRMS